MEAMKNLLEVKLREFDPELNGLILDEIQRNEGTINLIASENYPPKSAMKAIGSMLSGIYSEGYPGERYYRGLEIIDNFGRVRSQILVIPPSSMPNGRSYPETTLFRLIDTNGRPAIKIGASVDGSAMSMEGDSERTEWSGVQILAQGGSTIFILTNKDMRRKTISP